MLFKNITLTCTKQMNAERTISAIFHLLNGKKSIQTVQDAHNYQITSFFGVLPSLQKSTYDKKINKYINKGYLHVIKEQNTIQVTSLGEQWLEKHKSKTLNEFNGIMYAGMDVIFLQRLLLMIQVISNSKAENYSYIPIIDKRDITNWVKQYYKRISNDINDASKKLVLELTKALRHITNLEANMFVDRLTGYKTYGLSINQLANKYNLNPLNTELIIMKTTHQLLTIITNQAQTYEMLFSMVQDLSKETYVTNSANETYQLLNLNYTVAQIAQMRKLKENTIYDHLVEISLYDDSFPFHKYINKNFYDQIINVIKQNESFKLKDIKDQVDQEISYFQIRLALAKRSSLNRKELLNI